ncbi:hypothetical protein ACFOGJ_25190 [Marinibaculum pumilum]|uniref:Uncharacterized protein n=1 Tax=Marinibaculum pumilum TaxID=1766165 RepID=A0ABV7L7D1_9PROT
MECMETLAWICTGFAALLPALAAAFQAGATELAVDHSHWQSPYGPMELAVFERTLVGRYPDFDGVIVGRLSGDGARADLVWIQPKSNQRCAEPAPGLSGEQREALRMGGMAGDGHHWGRIAFSVQDLGARMAGEWAYCDAPMGSGGNWDSLRLRAERRRVALPAN